MVYGGGAYRGPGEEFNMESNHVQLVQGSMNPLKISTNCLCNERHEISAMGNLVVSKLGQFEA
jgi:hypothetical protein